MLGNFIFDWQLLGIIDVQSILQLGISVIYSVLPMQTINELIWPLEGTDEQTRYHQALSDNLFEVTYDEMNPINRIYKEC